MRRLFFLLGILYMMRSITMYVTVLPVASTTYVCSPKSNHTSAAVITLRAIRLFLGNKNQNCRLFILKNCWRVSRRILRSNFMAPIFFFAFFVDRNGSFYQRPARLLRRLHLQWAHGHSDHCLPNHPRMWVFSYAVNFPSFRSLFSESDCLGHLNIYKSIFPADTPRKWYILHWTSWLVSSLGVVFVMVAHGHYTVDVLIAYYVTTRLFWMYHTMANNAALKVKLL